MHKTVHVPEQSCADLKAYELVRSPFFLHRVLEGVKKAGLVGEEQNALATYVVAVSRLREKPLCLFIKGPSAVGKNIIARSVFRLLPPECVFEITSATETSWAYQGKNLMHRIVFDQEIEGSGTAHPSRLLVSENKIIRWVNENAHGQWVPTQKVARGPVSSISTSTKSRLQVDDESRHVSIWADPSDGQTEDIVAAYARNSSGLDKREFEAWHKVQKFFEARAKLPVTLPEWFQDIPRFVWKGHVRVRRYFPAFVEACKTVCLIRSFRNSDASAIPDSLQVRFSDFAVTCLIFGPAFTMSLRSTVSSDCYELREAVETISRENGGEPADAKAVARQLGVHMDRAYKLLRDAAEEGVVKRVNQPERNNPKRYLVEPPFRFLPDPKTIFQKLSMGPKKVTFVHPLTGKWVTYRRKG